MEQPVTIVAIHGNGGGSFRFSQLRPFLPPQMHFVAVTLPGFAAIPADPALQSVADYAQWLHQALKKLPQQPPGWWSQPGDVMLSAERPFILLGTGIGGSIALSYLQQFASQLDGVILHAPVGTRIDTRLFPRLMKLPGMRRLGQWAFSTPLLRPVWRQLLFTKPLSPDVRQRFFEEYRQCQVFGQMFDIITADWFASLSPSSVPAAFLWGERERVLSVEQLEDYKQLLPNHTVRTVPEWDHFPMLETPAAYVAELTALADALVNRPKPDFDGESAGQLGIV